jgi:hypothetical protein
MMVQQSNSTRTVECHIFGFDGHPLEIKCYEICNECRVQTLLGGGF